MFLLDTNVLSELMKPHPAIEVFRWKTGKKNREVFISAVSKAEIEFGVARLPAGKRKSALSVVAGEIFIRFQNRCLPFDKNDGAHFADIRATGEREGKPVGIADAMIAAIARRRRLILISGDSGFNRIDKLKTLNPWL